MYFHYETLSYQRSTLSTFQGQTAKFLLRRERKKKGGRFLKLTAPNAFDIALP